MMGTDRRIYSILHLGETLMESIDPDGIASQGTVRKIRHDLTCDGEAFNWKVLLEFPSGDMMTISGKWHEQTGLLINRCRLVSGDESENIPTEPSERLFTAIRDFSGIPARYKRNLSRISLKKAENEVSEDRYDIKLLYNAMNALFWEMDTTEISEREKRMFTEITAVIHKDKTDIIGKCPVKNGRIVAKTSVDIYGLGAKTVAVEKNLGEKNEVSAYCYTEDISGRKIPSIRMAFSVNSLLSGSGTQQRKEQNRIGLPGTKK